MKNVIVFLKCILGYIIAWFNSMQEREDQRIADSDAHREKLKIENRDRGIIRRQLLKALTKLPDWYNIHRDSVFFDGVNPENEFVYRLSKLNVEKHLSKAVCQEITDALNTQFRQISFDAFEVVNYAYTDAVYSIQTVMTELSARADWNTSEIQGRFNAEFQKAKNAYALTYRTYAPFLVRLQAIATVEDGCHAVVSVVVADESESIRCHPDSLPFC